MDYATIGRVHGSSRWVLIYGPDSQRSVHRNFWKRSKSNRKHRTYAEIWLCGPDGILKKTFNRQTGQDVDSSSSASSNSSSSSSSTVASVTSSSSSTAASLSSSSSSSVNSSSSSSSS